MQERIGNWFWTSALVLAACGGVDDPGSLAQSRAALGPASAPRTSPSSASFAPPPGERTCRSDADCAAGEQCESEHGQYYCAARHEDKDYYGSDAGAPQAECHHHGRDCYAGSAPDAGSHAECDDDEHHGGEYSDDDDHEERVEPYEDRSGSNRGPH
ncbi:MAG TPA: hypothetical protein VFS67_00050 [Polyangiaceae bacterium]|jgi:hypothetical protein|nr:hypothetical protein [Polyangiaceae bacterium]